MVTYSSEILFIRILMDSMICERQKLRVSKWHKNKRNSKIEQKDAFGHVERGKVLSIFSIGSDLRCSG